MILCEKNKHKIQAGFGIYLDKKNAAGTFYTYQAGHTFL